MTSYARGTGGAGAPGPQPRLGQAAERSLLAAVARGELPAAERFFSAHVDRLYGFFRLCLDSQAEAEAAVKATFSRVSRRVVELAGGADPAAWLIGVAVGELASHWRAAGPLDPASLPKPTVGASPPISLRQIGDTALAVLIRTLEPRRRQALVLHAVYGLEPARVAAALNVSEGEAAGLAQAARAELSEHLHGHQRKQSRSAALVAKVPYHLRPLPGPLSNGIVTVRGTHAYVAPGPGGNPLLFAMRQALDRFLEWLRHRHHHAEVGDDEVGGPSKRGKSPEATPTAQPFDSPKLTPSLSRHSQPRPTPGTLNHRAPKGTPSTQRISSRRSPIPSGAMPYGRRAHRG